jgi:hypothetical protein
MSEQQNAANAANAEEAVAEEATQTETPVVEDVAIVRHDPTFINTDAGAIAVYGHENVSKKFLEIVGAMLTTGDLEDTDHNVRSIVLRTDGLPMKPNADGDVVAQLGLFELDSGAVVLNLMHIFSTALDAAIDNPVFSIECCLHQTLLVTALHEFHHAATLFEDSVQRKAVLTGDVDVIKEMDDDADAWAAAALYNLAKVYDIEPAHISESPFFAAQLMELLTGDKSDFVKNQTWMHENHVLFFKEGTDEAEDAVMHTFKEVCHVLSGAELDDPEWQKQTIAAPITMMDQVEEVLDGSSDSIDGVVTPPAVTAGDAGTTAVNEVPVDVEPHVAMSDDVEMDTSYGDYCDDDYAADIAAAGAPVQQSAVPMTGQPAGQPAVQQQAQPGPAQNQAPAPQTPAQAPLAAGQVYPHPGVDNDRAAQIVRDVMDRCVKHIFGVCGRAHAYPEQDWDFGDGGPVCNVNNVANMSIPLTEEEKRVIVKCDHHDANGKWCPGDLITNSGLVGWVTKNVRIPMYKIYCNIGGFEYQRTIVPQDPNGKGPDAALARNGQSIVRVADDAIPRSAGWKARLKRRYVDGVWFEMNNGVQTQVY